MKTLLVLSIVLCAAFAAPAEEQEMAPAVDAPKEQMAAVPEMEEKMMIEGEVVPEDSVLENAPVSEEAEAPESRFSICPNGWLTHGAQCFRFINTAMNWYTAEEHCNGLGGHLASASDAREYTFLQSLLVTARQSNAWLGGFKLQGKWLWIDGQGFYYTNWYSQSSSTSYPCIFARSTYGWGNHPCTSSFQFICSKNAFGC